MKIEYFILSIAIMLALMITGPVSAYSITVSAIHPSLMTGMFANNPVIPRQDHGNQIFTCADTGITSGANSNGSIGSANAFSKGLCESQTTYLEFSNSVSVQGIINKFALQCQI